jgi:hypothetical protein
MEASDLRAVGDRIESLLEQIRTADPRARQHAEELVRLVTELYGAALERIVASVTEAGLPRGELLERLASDELVASLLLVHGLHPTSTAERVEAALDRARQACGAEAADVRLLDIDEERGRVRVRILGDARPGSVGELEKAVQQAITDLAPDILQIDLEFPPPPEPVGTPVHLTRRTPTMASAEAPQ